jgi:hypothetical protein
MGNHSSMTSIDSTRRCSFNAFIAYFFICYAYLEQDEIEGIDLLNKKAILTQLNSE